MQGDKQSEIEVFLRNEGDLDKVDPNVLRIMKRRSVDKNVWIGTSINLFQQIWAGETMILKQAASMYGSGPLTPSYSYVDSTLFSLQSGKAHHQTNMQHFLPKASKTLPFFQ